MLTFPLRTRPTADYHTGGRRFGATRDGGRKHGGCDLIAPNGTEILAVDDGTVINGPYAFYHGTYALEVRHTYLVVRYGEISRVATGILVGSRVTRGQVIAYIGRMNVDSMLHIEMYSGFDSGPLTVRANVPFERRLDLMDPTDFLDRAQLVSP
ncbi:MAG TPA: M23 family metallopeptidase [Bryobacteraceae bacterium]|nr:M23 family metallopeptidase [Bryobacteraceae bacterium]